MFRIDIDRWVPKFILRDKNGYAVAKALEAALQYMNDTVAAGVGLINNYDTMPEWRLDELAWEYNVLYDYTADIETKRRWIKNASQTYAIYGTPEVIKNYLNAIFFSSDLLENWDYDGDPYHFKIIISGEQTTENAAIVQEAVEKIKNVRSILDGIIYQSSDSDAAMKTGANVSGYEVVVTSNAQ